MTQTILGIDAAWTRHNPSGVAVARREADGWRLVTHAASYRDFLGGEGGHEPDAGALLARVEALAGARPDIVAIDMPLATVPIVGRRASDNAVNRRYASKWCATHSPSRDRPGCLGDDLRAAFGAAGYPLAVARFAGPALLEVYPHVALVELMGAEKRLPYKVAKAARYWPKSTMSERRRSLIVEWERIIDALDRRVGGTAGALKGPLSDLDPDGRDARAFKALEDRIDAVVCAWVGIEALEGRALPLGDEDVTKRDSAIWVPEPRSAAASPPPVS